MSVEISDEQDIPINITRLQRRLQASLDKAGLGDAEVSILLTGDDRIAELNETYRGLPEPTDVLSFPLNDDEDEPFGNILGDIVISVPTAQRQASGTLENELDALAFHGLLHLLGRDHETEGWEAWEVALKEILPDE
jgi:probable rRNA maturation factor